MINLLNIAYYFSFLICVWLIFFIISKNPKGLANKVCAMLILCFAIWNFSVLFLQNSKSGNEAMLWKNISSFGWCGFAGFAIWLSYIITWKDIGKKIIKWHFYPLIFIFPAFFIFMQWNGYLVVNFTKHAYGWVYEWSTSIWPMLFFVYYFSFIILALAFAYLSINKRIYNFEKKRKRLIIISASIFLIAASTTEIVLPLLKVYIVPPIGSIFSVILAAAFVYSINKYKFLSLNPAYAASDIISNMSDSLILIDSESKIIEANNALLNMLGYSSYELIGSGAEKLFMGQRPANAAVKWELLFKKESFKNIKIVFRTKDGDDIPISFSGSAMKDNEGNYIGIVCIGRDMREIYRLQEREQELVAEKARTEAFQERARELQKAYDSLKTAQTQLIQSEKMAAVGRLAGGVAHEINNPLGVILGFAQSIIKRIKEDDPLYIPLKSIEREVIRCRKMIVDLLKFSRTENTMAEDINLNRTIEETLSFVGSRAKVMGIDIIKEFQDDLPLIRANNNQIQQLIVNLCNNAIESMPEGGKIKITTGRIGNSLEFSISDTGIGMSEENKMHIFEPFYATTGLSVCREIINKHNGTIEVESVLNNGTLYKINLPLDACFNK